MNVRCETQRDGTLRRGLIAGAAAAGLALTPALVFADEMLDGDRSPDGKIVTESPETTDSPARSDRMKDPAQSEKLESEPGLDRQIQLEDETISEQVAQRIAAAAFDEPGAVEASDDLLGGWKVTGENVDLAVEATDGALRLSGTIDKLDRIDAIENEAREVPGVKSVTSSIELAGNGKANDESEMAE